MKFLYNDCDVLSLENLLLKLNEGNENFDIVIEIDDKNWIQFFYENDIVSVAWKKQNKLKYSHIKIDSLKVKITEYCNNNSSFTLKTENKSKYVQPVGESLKGILGMFLTFLLFNLIEIVFIVTDVKYTGSPLQKILKYYCDRNLPAGHVCAPVGLLISFVFLIVCLIKYILCKTKRNKHK